MGFYSWKCSVSGESISTIHAGRPREQSQCYLVTPSKTYFEAAYEGYGKFEGVDVFEMLGEGDRDKGIDDFLEDDRAPKHQIKLVLKKYYNNQTYEELPASELCNQGHFY